MRKRSRNPKRESKNEIVRKEEVSGHKAVIASLKFQEARNANRLVAVINEVAKATDKIDAMELTSATAYVGGDAESKKEVAYLEGKVKAIESQIYLIKNRLGADLVKFGNVDLKSLADTYVFVKTTMPGDQMTFRCFYDMVVMLDSLMAGDTDLSVFVKTAADASKGLYKNATESCTSCSFNRAAPAIFVKKAGSEIHGGTVDCLFGVVKECSLWTRTDKSHLRYKQLS